MRAPIEPITYTVPEAGRVAGIGVTKLYELIGHGILDARKAGRRTLITADSLRAYLAALPRAEVRQPRQRIAA